MRRASATHTEQRAELALKKLTFAIVDDHEYIAHARFRITLKPFILCLYLYTISKDIFKGYTLYFILYILLAHGMCHGKLEQNQTLYMCREIAKD